MSGLNAGKSGVLLIKTDGSIDVDVLDKMRKELSKAGTTKNIYSKIVLFCLDRIVNTHYKGVNGKPDKSIKLHPDVAGQINEQFAKLLDNLSKENVSKGDLKENVSYVVGTLSTIKKAHAGTGKDPLVEKSAAVMKQLGATLTEDAELNKLIGEIDKATTEELGSRGLFIFAMKSIQSSMADSMRNAASTAAANAKNALKRVASFSKKESPGTGVSPGVAVNISGPTNVKHVGGKAPEMFEKAQNIAKVTQGDRRISKPNLTSHTGSTDLNKLNLTPIAEAQAKAEAAKAAKNKNHGESSGMDKPPPPPPRRGSSPPPVPKRPTGGGGGHH